jgi:hypothetical protein
VLNISPHPLGTTSDADVPSVEIAMIKRLPILPSGPGIETEWDVVAALIAAVRFSTDGNVISGFAFAF